jgi:ketosteroid isomerase-like protein
MSPAAYLSLLFEAMNNKTLNALESAFSDNVVFHFPKTAPLEGKRRISTFLKVLFRKYPDLTFTLGRTVGDDRMAAAEWTNQGTTKSGEIYQNAGVTFLEVENGKIAYISDTFKSTENF